MTVENRTGGSGNIAGEAVSRAAPDGYTLLATPPNIVTVNAALFKKLGYDPARSSRWRSWRSARTSWR